MLLVEPCCNSDGCVLRKDLRRSVRVGASKAWSVTADDTKAVEHYRGELPNVWPVCLLLLQNVRLAAIMPEKPLPTFARMAVSNANA